MEKQVGSNSVTWLATPEVFKQTVHTYSQTLHCKVLPQLVKLP